MRVGDLGSGDVVEAFGEQAGLQRA
ncbi:MAG: hypothetical protein QOH37_3620, partial [Nocardioidaceae bacterium]|nr:hypothetical protein [Nocardioidaceae bacterium]